MRPTALFLLSTGHIALRELRPVLERFHAEGWRVAARLGASGPQTIAAAAQMRAQGIDAALIPPGIGYEAQPDAAQTKNADTKAGDPSIRLIRSRAREALMKVLRPLFVHRLAALWRSYWRAKRHSKWGAALIAEVAPDVVLLNMFHSVGEVDNGVQRAARRAGLPLYCLTNSAYVGEGIQLVSRMNHLDSGIASCAITAGYDPLNKLLARLFSGWTRTLSDGTVAFYWDPVRILGAHLAGLNMNRLWLKPSLDFDKVFVFSDFSRKLLADCGYPQERIIVAGQPLLDGILKRQKDPVRQREVAAHTGVAPGMPFVLLNVEPSLEHSYATAEEHWSRFHEVMRACVSHDLPVILSLHPLCDAADYAFAELQYNVRISTEVTIHELYPWCTISVSFPCSTNLLALQLGKPLVLYDYQRILDRDAVSDSLFRLPGAFVARNEADLRACIAEALSSAPALAPNVQKQEEACAIIFETVAYAVSQRQGASSQSTPEHE